MCNGGRCASRSASLILSNLVALFSRLLHWLANLCSRINSICLILVLCVHTNRLLRWTYPALHAHFAFIELSPEVITAQWFLTLFTYTFPVVPTVLQLWDYVFLTGWEGMRMKHILVAIIFSGFCATFPI